MSKKLIKPTVIRNNRDVGRILRAQRKALGYTQQYVVEQIRIGRPRLVALERGQLVEDPGFNRLMRLISLYGLAVRLVPRASPVLGSMEPETNSDAALVEPVEVVDKHDIGRLLRREREEHGYTQQYVDRCTGFGRSSLSLLETGKLVEDPGLNRMMRLITFYGLSVTLGPGDDPSLGDRFDTSFEYSDGPSP